MDIFTTPSELRISRLIILNRGSCPFNAARSMAASLTSRICLLFDRYRNESSICHYPTPSNPQCPCVLESLAKGYSFQIPLCLKFNFGDGGAFPEIHMLQYPGGLGRKEGVAPKQSSSSTGASSSTAASSSNALIIRAQEYSAEELVRPKAEELEQNDQRTANKLALVIAQKTAASSTGVKTGGPQQATSIVDYTPQLGTSRTIKVVEVQQDPFAPSKFKAKKLTKGAVGDPAPIVRSPTKKRTASENVGGKGVSEGGSSGVGAFGGDLASLGAKVAPSLSNFKNPRNLAIPIEQRVAAERNNMVGGGGLAGTTLGKPANAASSLHLTLKQRMMQAAIDQQKVSDDTRRDRAAEQEAEQRKQDDVVESEALAAILKGNKQAAEQRCAETAEERASRIQAEREERDRRKDEERKMRKEEDTAKRLGISVEDVQAGQADLDDQAVIADERAANAAKAGGQGEALYDNPLFGTNKGKNKFTYRHTSIQEEMKKQEQQSSAPAAGGGDAGSDDVFGVVSALRGKRGRGD